jgi:hypothetical protein
MYIRAMKAATASTKPVLMKNFAGQYAFMLWQVGHEELQPN